MTPRILSRVQVHNSESKYFDDNGFLVHKNVPIARAGGYTYMGFEFGLKGPASKEPYNVYRPITSYTEELLEKFGGTVVTNDHPTDQVTPENFKKEVIGNIGDKVFLRGEDVIAETITIRDAAAIKEIEENGKKELSIGFTAEYDLKPVVIDGVEYDGIERILAINHISLVNEGKAGSQYRFNKVFQSNEGGDEMTTTVMHNGIELNTAEQIAQAYNAVSAELEELRKSTTNSDMINAIMERLNAMEEKMAEKAEDKKNEDEPAKKEDAKNTEEEEEKKDTKNEDDEKEVEVEVEVEDKKRSAKNAVSVAAELVQNSVMPAPSNTDAGKSVNSYAQELQS